MQVEEIERKGNGDDLRLYYCIKQTTLLQGWNGAIIENWRVFYQ